MFCCKQKTAYEMRISDWSSDVCSSDLIQWRVAMLAELFAIRARAVVVGLLIELPCRLVAAQAMHEDHYTRLRGGESCSECRTRNAEPHTVAIEAELRRDRVAATDQMISEQTAERAERDRKSTRLNSSH